DVAGDPGPALEVLGRDLRRLLELRCLAAVLSVLPEPRAVAGRVDPHAHLLGVVPTGDGEALAVTLRPGLVGQHPGTGAGALERGGVPGVGQAAGEPVAGDGAGGDVVEGECVDTHGLRPPLGRVALAHDLGRVAVPAEGDRLVVGDDLV